MGMPIIEGDDEIVNAFRNAGTAINLVGRAWLKEWSDYGVKQSQKHLLNAGAVDTNELIQGMFYYITDLSDGLEATISPSDKADEYAIYVEEGTKPHFPPIAALQGWADRHGIPVWAVALSIAKKGTKPRLFLQRTFYDLDRRVNSDLGDFAQDLARRL